MCFKFMKIGKVSRKYRYYIIFNYLEGKETGGTLIGLKSKSNPGWKKWWK